VLYFIIRAITIVRHSPEPFFVKNLKKWRTAFLQKTTYYRSSPFASTKNSKFKKIIIYAA